VHYKKMNIKKIIKGQPKVTEKTAYAILFAISFGHFLNDMIQSVVPSIYPMIKQQYGFTFAQIGIITFVFQMMSSLLQPVVGWYSDCRPRPYSLAIGMCFTLAGLCLLAYADSFALILMSVSIIGWGSSVFHPESSRVAQMASGGKKSLAQSIFQVGGNGGSAIGPLLAAIIVLPYGQGSIAWFSIAAIIAVIVLTRVGAWYSAKLVYNRSHSKQSTAARRFDSHTIRKSMAILVTLIFSKYFFTSCMTSYFTFFLIEKFHVSVQASQLCLFSFLTALAIGTVVGGTLGDRYGRKYVILGSIFGAAPFAMAMPYVGFAMTVVLAFIAGFIIASAFSAILVYATDLVPDKLGIISGVFFGLMFGLGGIGSAFFGWLADLTDIEFIFRVSSLLPLLGVCAVFLPNIRTKQ